MFTLALAVSVVTVLFLLPALTDVFTPSFTATPAAPCTESWNDVRDALRDAAPVSALFNPSAAALAHWARIDAERLAALRGEIARHYRGESTRFAAPSVSRETSAPSVSRETSASEDADATRAVGAPRKARVLRFYSAGAAHGAIVVRADGSRVSGLVRGLAAQTSPIRRAALALAALA